MNWLNRLILGDDLVRRSYQLKLLSLADKDRQELFSYVTREAGSSEVARNAAQLGAAATMIWLLDRI